MATEDAIYEDANIRITPTRAVIGEKTYAIAHITSVSASTVPASLSGVCLWFALGIVLSGISILMLPIGFISANTGNYGTLILASAFGIVGVGLIGLSVVSGFRLKPSYAVKISSASGETKVFLSNNLQYIRKIIDAMNEAIVKRG